MASGSPAEPDESLSHAEEKKDENFGYAMQLAMSSVLPMTLQAAFELGIFEIMAAAGTKLSASEISAKLPTQNPDASMMLDRILRLLASYSVLSCSLDGTKRLYSLAHVAKFFVRNQDGVSLGPLMNLINDKVFWKSWSQLKDAVLEGGTPFDRAYGMHAFEYPGLDPRFNQVFNAAMFNQTTMVINSILNAYKGFEHVKQLVDVGGGLGHTLNAITSKYSHIKGINFDLPHVIQHAPAYPGVEHVGGDMFESVPKGDTIFMKWIIHDWSDEHCLKLLKNCYHAIPDDGKVLVVETILPAMAETSSVARATFASDMLMMTQNPGGKERTQDEFLSLAIGSGFQGITFQCFVCNFWVMEFFK